MTLLSVKNYRLYMYSFTTLYLIIKNRNHYRDKAQRIENLEVDILQCLGQAENSQALCALLKATSPNSVCKYNRATENC